MFIASPEKTIEAPAKHTTPLRTPVPPTQEVGTRPQVSHRCCVTCDHAGNSALTSAIGPYSHLWN